MILWRCSTEAERHGLVGHVTLTFEEVEAIRQVNPLYDKKELEYSTLAAGDARLRQLPALPVLLGAARRLQLRMRQVCRDGLDRAQRRVEAKKRRL